MPSERAKRKAPERPSTAESLANVIPEPANLKHETATWRRIAEHDHAKAAHAPYGNGTKKHSSARNEGLFENEERDVTEVKKLASFPMP